MTGGSFATWSKTPLKGRLQLCHRGWKTEVPSSLMTIFQRDGPSEGVLGCKMAETLRKKIYAPKGQRKK